MSLTHLGIIADGNRRWAKENGLPTIEGHKRGMDNFRVLVDAAMKAKIKYISFYLFSTENWNRSKEEVDYLMMLANKYILKFAKDMAAKNGKLLILGTKDRLSPGLISAIEKAEEITANCDGITACFCFNYGGEQEIADATNIALEAEGEITPATIRKHLYHPEVPDLDMVVRTGGEERISGFMLWRASYSEFMFIDKYYPEMEAEDIQMILDEYNSRNRRFGK